MKYPNIFAAVVVMLAAIGLGQPVFAHSFNALLVQGGTVGEDVYDAFRMATKENDGHAMEESDGHLGGLDVYILAPGDFGGLVAAIKSGEIDFIVFLGSQAPDAGTRALIDAQDIVSVEVLSVTDRMQSEFLDGTAAGIESFQERFRRDYSRDPLADAALAYIAARLIDLAVRDQGEVDDRDALREILAQY